MVGMDPGVRNLLTVVNPTNGLAYTVGNAAVDLDGSEMEKFYLKRNALNSQAAEARKAGKHQLAVDLAASAKKAHAKLKGIRDNAHRHVARHLCGHGLVAFGDLNVHSVMSNSGKMAKSTKRRLNLWSLGDLRRRLVGRAKGTRCSVKIVDEYLTSKTCSVCNRVDRHLGASKRYKCTGCGLDMDRDVNGAFNILRGALGEWTPERTNRRV